MERNLFMKGKNLALVLLFLAAAALAFLVGRYLGNRQETPGSSAVSEAVSSGNSEPQSGPESSRNRRPPPISGENLLTPGRLSFPKAGRTGSWCS